jgi:LysM repeat protein
MTSPAYRLDWPDNSHHACRSATVDEHRSDTDAFLGELFASAGLPDTFQTRRHLDIVGANVGANVDETYTSQYVAPSPALSAPLLPALSAPLVSALSRSHSVVARRPGTALWRFVALAVGAFAMVLLFFPSGVEAGSSDPMATVDYVVEEGDTLWGIAATLTPAGGNLRDTIDVIKNANGIDSSIVHAGELIQIPATR